MLCWRRPRPLNTQGGGDRRTARLPGAGTSRRRHDRSISDYGPRTWSACCGPSSPQARPPGTAAAATVYFTLQTGDFAGTDRVLPGTQGDLRITRPTRRSRSRSARFGPIARSPAYQLKKNQWVETHLPAANRDERVFERPHEFDIDRPDIKNARPFGDIPHYCIGSHYGQLVGAHVITTLATQLPGLALLPKPRPYRRHTGLLHRLDSLPALTNV